MPNGDDIQKILNDFVATVEAKPNLTDKELLDKFPELENDQEKLIAAKDYYSTSKYGTYKTVEELNEKFPEFFDVKKKEPSEPTGEPTEEPSEQPTKPSVPTYVEPIFQIKPEVAATTSVSGVKPMVIPTEDPIPEQRDADFDWDQKVLESTMAKVEKTAAENRKKRDEEAAKVKEHKKSVADAERHLRFTPKNVFYATDDQREQYGEEMREKGISEQAIQESLNKSDRGNLERLGEAYESEERKLVTKQVLEERLSKKQGPDEGDPIKEEVDQRIAAMRTAFAHKHLTEEQRVISDLVSKHNDLSEKGAKTPEQVTELLQLEQQINVLKENPKQLYDPASGGLVDVEDASDEAVKYDSEVNEESNKLLKSFQDKLADIHTKRYAELQEVEKLFNGRLSYTAGGTTYNLSPAELSAMAVPPIPFIGSDSMKQAERMREIYNKAKGSYDAVNRALLLNEDPAGVEKGFLAAIGESVTEAILPVEVETNRDYIRNYVDTMRDEGGPISDEQEKKYEDSLAEKTGDAIGNSIPIMLEIAATTMLTEGVGTIPVLARVGNALKTALTARWGKSGMYAYNLIKEPLRASISFGAAPSEDVTAMMGLGEGFAQGVMTSLNPENWLKGSKYAKLLEFGARTLAGTTTETVQEFTGEYMENLDKTGFDYDKAFEDTFGRNMDDFWDQLAVIGLTSAAFSGAFNSTVLLNVREKIEKEMPDSDRKKEYMDAMDDASRPIEEMKEKQEGEAPVEPEYVKREVEGKEVLLKRTEEGPMKVVPETSEEYTQNIDGAPIESEIEPKPTEEPEDAEKIGEEAEVPSPEEISEPTGEAEQVRVRGDVEPGVEEGAVEEVAPKEPFVSKQGYTVEKTDEGLNILSKKGKEPSKTTKAKVIKEYEDQFDYTQGRTAEEQLREKGIEPTTPKDLAREVAERSENPMEIIETHEQAKEYVDEVDYRDQVMEDYVSNIDKESYKRFGDPNKIGVGMAKQFFAKKGEPARHIDELAQEMSEVAGVEITPEQVVTFMEEFKAKRKVSPEQVALQDRFREITGLNLNDRVRGKALEPEAQKRIEDYDRPIEETEAKTLEQAEREFYEGIREGRIPIKEPEVSSIAKGREAIPKGTEPEVTAELINEQGQQVESRIDAERIISAGEKLYAIPEQEATPVEIKSMKMLEGYTVDQLFSLPKKAEPTKIAEVLRTAAEKLREGKISKLGGFKAGTGFDAVWDASIEVVAKSLEAGANVADSIAKGLEYIKGTEWYKALSDKEKTDLDEKYNQHLGKELVEEKAAPAEEEKAPEKKEEPTVPKKEAKKTAEEQDEKAADEALGVAEEMEEYTGGLDSKNIKKAVDKKRKLIETINKKGTKDAVREMIFDRRAEIAVSTFETKLFVEGIKEKTTPLQRELIPFLIEGTSVPKEFGRPDLEKAYETDREKLAPVVKEIKDHFDQVWDKIVRNTDKMSVEQIKDYVTHIWDIPKNKKADVVSWFATKNQFLNKRHIDTLEQGIKKFGLKPRVLDVGEIIQVHGSMANNVIANAKFVKEIKQLGRDGMPMIMKSHEAPPDWEVIDHPALTSKMVVPGEEGKVARQVDVQLKVHPDLKKPLLVVFDKRIDQPFWNAWEKIGGILKKTQLSLSLFHHGALTETAVPTMGAGKTIKTALKDSVYEGLRKGGKTLPFKNPELTKDALKAGLQLGASIDIPIQDIQGMMKKLTEKTENIPVIKHMTKLAESFNEKWDALLWDYLHDGLKIMAFEDARSKMPLDTKDPVKYMRERAQLINDTFGGQNWDVLMTNPKSLQIMRWFLLSPDWTISTIRQALSPTGIGAMYKETAGVRKKAGAMFWLKAAMYYGVLMNSLSYYYRSKDEEENSEFYGDEDLDFWDKTMFGNTLGHKTHLFFGRYDDGTERYIRWGKQFRELPELLMDDEGMSFPKPALKKLGGKASPQAQIIFQLFTGKSVGGYENWDLKDKKGWEWSLGAMKMLGKSALPFSSGSLLRDDKEWYVMDLVMPSSKGMSKSKAIDLFKKGIARGDEDYVREVYDGAVRNQLDAFGLFNVALSTVKATGTKELFNDVKTIEDIDAKMKTATDPLEKKKLIRKRKALVKSNMQKNNALNLLDQVMRKMREAKSKREI